MLKNIDGVPVFKDSEGDLICSFDDWLRQEHGQVWEGIFNDLAVDGKDEDEISDYKSDLLEDFYDWCNDNDIEGYEV